MIRRPIPALWHAVAFILAVHITRAQSDEARNEANIQNRRTCQLSVALRVGVIDRHIQFFVQHLHGRDAEFPVHRKRIALLFKFHTAVPSSAQQRRHAAFRPKRV